MVLKYFLAGLVVLALLTLLKFVQDSPIRSWKAVVCASVPLILVVCLWLRWAYPPPPPPQPKTERVSINRAELQRTLRRIEGVDRASISNYHVEINFGVDQTLSQIKSIARTAAGTAGYFLQPAKTNRITVKMSVRGQPRYEMEYHPQYGAEFERTY